MKLIVGDKAYLQPYDMRDVLYSAEFPAVCSELFRDVGPGGQKIITLDLGEGMFDFAFLLETPEAVKAVAECEWLVDFADYLDIGADILDDEAERLWARAEEIRQELLAQNVESPSDMSRRNVLKARRSRCQHRAFSLAAMARYLRGEVDFGFPEGYSSLTATRPGGERSSDDSANLSAT